jgi:hypothetical protein
VNTRWGHIDQRHRGSGGFREFIARRNALHQEAERLLLNNHYVTDAIDSGYVLQFNKGSLLGARSTKGNLLRPDIQIRLPDGRFGLLDFTTEGSAAKIFKYGSASEAPFMINITVP